MYGLDAVALFFTAALKFFFSIPGALLLGYSFWETVGITSAGGMSSVVFFYVLSARVMELYRRRRLKRIAKRIAKGKPVNIRYFTFLNKLMVRVKMRIGVAGMAFLTPTIISIPIGAVVSAKFFKHHILMLPALIISVFFWSVLLTSVFYYIGV